ncbi:MAG: dTDP-4-dehydrorhamnose reductase [Deltaproteobacteria bacterium]|nr:dTDP-4-dehydrorhamnose reductase [Deltaproteobacteria bacterium]
MTLLLTGADGQVGREVQRQAREKGHPILALNRSGLDITDANAVRQVVGETGPAMIVNAAAFTAVDKAEDEPGIAFRVNRDGAANLAKAAAEAGIPLVHLSTDYVFDGTNPRPYLETDPVAPIGVYGHSKWEGEEAIRQRLHHHLIIRVSWVFGVHGNNFVKTMLRLARERDVLRVVADQRGGPTYAGHIAAFILDLYRQIVNQETTSWGTYHFCGSPVTSWHAFAEAIVRTGHRKGILERSVAVHPITTADYPTRARRPANSALDCRKIEAYFGIHPKAWQTGLDDMLERLAKEDA